MKTTIEIDKRVVRLETLVEAAKNKTYIAIEEDAWTTFA